MPLIWESAEAVYERLAQEPWTVSSYGGLALPVTFSLAYGKTRASLTVDDLPYWHSKEPFVAKVGFGNGHEGAFTQIKAFSSLVDCITWLKIEMLREAVDWLLDEQDLFPPETLPGTEEHAFLCELKLLNTGKNLEE